MMKYMMNYGYELYDELYGDFHKWKYPKSSIFMGLSIKNDPFEGTAGYVQ